MTMRCNLKSGFERRTLRAPRHQRINVYAKQATSCLTWYRFNRDKRLPLSLVALMYRRRLPSRYICPLSRSQGFVLRKKTTCSTFRGVPIMQETLNLPCLPCPPSPYLEGDYPPALRIDALNRKPRRSICSLMYSSNRMPELQLCSRNMASRYFANTP